MVVLKPKIGMRGKRVGIVQYMRQRKACFIDHLELKYYLGRIIGYIPRLDGEGMVAICQLRQLKVNSPFLVAIQVGNIKIIEGIRIILIIVEYRVRS